MLQLAQIVWHHLFDEFLRFVEGRLVIDQDFADIVGEIIAQCSYDRVAFTVNQERRRAFHNDFLDGLPDGEEILHVPGQFFATAIDTCRSENDAHSIGHVDLPQRLSRQVTILTDDAS